MTSRRVYAVVALCAVVVYLGARWNRWAFDDLVIVVGNDLVHSPSGWWRTFVSPYLPAELGGYLYRPLTVATYVLDWHLDGVAWFHAVNILWHAGAAVLVAVLVNRWVGTRATLLAGVVFAVHPVHVEAVANVVGRAELDGNRVQPALRLRRPGAPQHSLEHDLLGARTAQQGDRGGGARNRRRRPYLIGTHAALNLGRPALADSLLKRADRFCNPCQGYYRAQATVARRLGDSTAVRYLMAHAQLLNR